MKRACGAILAVLAGLSFTSLARAFEAPQTVSVTTVLGGTALNGPNYRIDPEVVSDGLMRLYVLKTRYGTFDVTGDDLLRVRLREMSAVSKLEAMSTSDVFVKSLGEAGAAPLRYGADLITDPMATLKKSASGVANMFDRLGSGIANRSSSRDNAITSLAGIDGARRALAVELGVDPYTDFPPLASKLNDIASASGLGGLSVKAMLMVIPGGVGMAASSASSADTIRATLAQKTSSQIVEIVKKDLQQLQVSPNVVARLVQNRAYTPADLLIMAKSLTALRASNTNRFVSRAAAAPTRDEAFFQRRRTELLAANAGAFGITSFVDVGGFPLNRTRGGALLALFPIDEISWTEGVGQAFGAATKAANASPLILATQGSLTPLARREIETLGWSIKRLP